MDEFLNKSLEFTIENFRVFGDPYKFNLAPITLLTGPNNSGKSSLIKALLMLKSQNGKEDIPSTITLPNNQIQLSQAKDVLNDINSTFKIDFCVPYNHYKLTVTLEYGYDLEWSDGNLELESVIVKSDDNIVMNIDLIYSDKKTIFDFNFWLEYARKSFNAIQDARNQLSKKSYKKENYNYALFDLEHEDRLLGPISEDARLRFLEIQEELAKEIFEVNESNFDVLFFKYIYKVRRIYEDDTIDLKNILKDRLQLLCLEFYEDELNKRVKQQFPGTYNFIKTELYFHFKDLYSNIYEDFVLCLSKLIDIEVIPVNKGLSSRIFQPDDLNLSFLSNAAIQLKLSMHNEYSKYDEFRNWLNGWLIHFEIGKSIDIINLEGRGVYTIEIIDFDGSRKNLKDLGFGISQIISILLSPYISNFKFNDYQSQMKGELIVDKFEILDKQPVYYLEEPESNLHPSYQSKLMELFIDINKRFGIRFIIETHSEYLIRKLQNLVAQKVVNNDHLQIYYFNSDKFVTNTEPKVKQIILRDDGIMANGFGPGFYDEAVRLTVELLKIENYN